MTSKFVTRKDIDDSKKHELFECLDQTDVKKCESFISLCNSLEDKNLIFTARDRRRGYEGRTLLHNAARSGKFAAVRHLISIMHPVDPVDSSVNLVTPLMDAIAFHHKEVAEYLVRAGASLTRQDMRGENALHYAGRAGSGGIVSAVAQAAGLSKDELKAAASTLSVKLKFPEDVSSNTHSREILTDYRELGERRKLKKKSGLSQSAR